MKNYNLSSDIAIIGMGCKFPNGSNSLEEYWNNLEEGADLLTTIPKDRWDIDQYYNTSNEDGTIKTRHGYFVDNVECFDSEFFGITPLEAKQIDPQQRILLETCQHAFDSAGLNTKLLNGTKSGVFIGLSNSDFTNISLSENRLSEIKENSLTGTLPSTASGRISYIYGLNGPCVTIDTACSSSLVSVDSAVNSLINFKCDLAITGGVNLILTPQGHIALSKLNALSSDGKCKVFDESANGYGRGEGCGILVLKRLSDAERDGDNIRAVIRSSAVNHDGKSAGLTIPNGLAQEQVIQDAMKYAKVGVDDIDYIETHGTGTKIGDPQEINALSNVFKKRKAGTPLLVGSVKSNIGHLESAAGVASIIRVVLSLEKGTLTKNLHQKLPNQLIPWPDIPIEVVKDNMRWESSSGKPLVAGISSFGISGTNSHVIVQEYRKNIKNDENHKPSLQKDNILVLSGKSRKSLDDTRKKYLNFLKNSNHELNDICFSSRFRDQQYIKRCAVVVNSKDELKNKLQASLVDSASNTVSKIAFLFTGQGSQYFGMARTLYDNFSVFRKAISKCDKLFQAHLSVSIEDIIYKDNNYDLNNTLYAQPAIFTVGYALSELLKSFNILPSAVLGHSIGQYIAAYVAGIISLQDAVRVVSERALLMSKVKTRGTMIAVHASLQEIRTLIDDKKIKSISVASVNSYCNITLSGSVKSVQQLVSILKHENIAYTKLKVSNAFHSQLMQDTVPAFKKILDKVNFNAPNIPIVSDITGKLNNYKNCTEITSTEYWSNHICNTVNFYDAVKTLINSDHNLFVEIGAMPVLSFLGSKSNNQDKLKFIFLLDNRQQDPMSLFLLGLTKLYNNGCDIDWSLINQTKKGKFINLPNYSFERSIYPIQSIFNSLIKHKSNATSKHDTVFNENINNESIENDLIKIIHQITGIILEKDKFKTNLIGLGLDSLMITKLRTKIEQQFNLSIPMTDLYGELNNFSDLVSYITKNQIAISNSNALTDSNIVHSDEIKPSQDSNNISSIFAQQLSVLQNVIEKQLNTLKGNEVKSVANQNDNNPVPRRKDTIAKLQSSFRMAKFEEDKLDEKQTSFVQEFIKRYNNKTKKSKDYNKKNKEKFAHYLTTVNFRKTLKELLYPLVSSKAEGQYMWDIDGNKYIDIALGYGVHFFGHKPKFVIDAVSKQLQKGSGLSPRTQLPSEVTSLIKELTGVERVSYCNTGSEAVMFALRIARTVTGRKKIVKFSGSYHGVYDGVLVEADEHGSYPSTAGLIEDIANSIIVLPYGSEESIETIKKMEHEIAAVLVEPVQSRNPGLQLKEFLQSLREVTENTGSALIFDEVITGFRKSAGGAQEFFNIQADITTYGKLVGGGLPIGIIAGKRKFLDAIDGGDWAYGDSSIPEKNVTFTAGTFSNHPLSMAAAKSVLSQIKEQGTALYDQVEGKMNFLITSLNKYFEEDAVPIRVRNFGSLFRFESIGNYHLALNPIEMDLFFYVLMSKGIYTWERKICFFSTVHTDSDIKQIIASVKSSVSELREGGFSFVDENAKLTQKKSLPITRKMTSSQSGLFILDSIKGDEKSYHLSGAVIINGKFDVEKAKCSIEKIINRHESLRSTFRIENDQFSQIVHPHIPSFFEYEESKETNIDHHIDKFIDHFDLEDGPLMRIKIIKIKSDVHLFLMDFHHIMMDGFSVNIFVQEFLNYYSDNKVTESPLQFSQFQTWENKYVNSLEFKKDQEFWKSKLSNYTSPARLPLDFSTPKKQSFSGNSIHFCLTKKQTEELHQLSREMNITLYMLLLSVFNVLVTKLTDSNEVVVGTPVALRDEHRFDEIIGMLTNTLVLKNNVAKTEAFSSFVKRTGSLCIESFSHRNYPFQCLVTDLEIERDTSRNSVFDIDFIYEKSDDRMFRMKDLEFVPYHPKNQASICDFSFEVLEEQGFLQLNFHYNTKLFKAETINRWKNFTRNIIQQILKTPEMEINNIQLIPV